MKNISLKLNWMSVVLLLSLGLNFFVIGYIYSQYQSKKIKMTKLSFDNSISRLVEPFPRKGKHDFYITMRSKRSELIPMYENIVAKRLDVMTIMAEDPFNKEKLQTAMRDYHETYHDLINQSHNVIVDVVSKLSAEERKELLERYNNKKKRSYGRNNDNDRNNDRRRMPPPNGEREGQNRPDQNNDN